MPVSIAIPTYRREAVLVETLDHLLALHPRAAEILVLDQTPTHQPSTESRLLHLADAGHIVWIRLPVPSITAAMNEGLRRAVQDIVLFVDDDVRPEPGLLSAHVAAHGPCPDGLVAGRVIQPWHEEALAAGDALDGFACAQAMSVNDFIGCNFSIARQTALALGGFDENFVRVAYRFEAEFAHRLRASGRRIHYEPRACLHHLKVSAGGTRSYGEHLTTWRPDHAVGAYYYSLRTGDWSEVAQRPWRSVATRYHLRRPWRIPATLFAELSGMLWALRLSIAGPRTLAPPPHSPP